MLCCAVLRYAVQHLEELCRHIAERGEERVPKRVRRMQSKIEALRAMVRPLSLPPLLPRCRLVLCRRALWFVARFVAQRT